MTKSKGAERDVIESGVVLFARESRILQLRGIPYQTLPIADQSITESPAHPARKMATDRHSSDISLGVETVEVLTLDDALEMNPLGRFHYGMLLLCGLAFASDALEVNLLSYLSTCAGSEFDLTPTQEASVSSVVFAGIMLGASFWGAFANAYGRKIAFLISCLIISLGGFITAAAPSYAWLLVIRLVVGFGIGGSPISFDLLAEFMPISHRGMFLMAIEFFWTFGSMFVNGMAWAFLDSAGKPPCPLCPVCPCCAPAVLCCAV